MCLSIPMRVVEWDDDEGNFAWVERGEGDMLRRERVNMMLIGPQEVGTWILASLGLGKEIVDEENRLLIEDALAALDESLHGDYDPASHFADLTRH